MLAAASDPSTRRPFGQSLPSTSDQTMEAIAAARGLWAHQGTNFDGRFAVRRVGNGRFLGHLRLWDEGNGLRVLAWFGPSARGQGLGTAAVRLACRFAFEDLHALRVEAHITLDNGASRSIVRGLGFTLRPGGAFTSSKDMSGMALVYQLPRGEWPPREDNMGEADLAAELAEAERVMAEHDANPDGDLPIHRPPGPHGDRIREFLYIERRAHHEDRVERARQSLRRVGRA